MTTHPHTSASASTYEPLPIPPATLAELRRADDSGRPVQPYTAREDGIPYDSVGSPLRCCLRAVEPGERVALVSYAPLRRWAAASGAEPGAYDEAGPVFIHAEECGGPREEAQGFRLARPGALCVLRRYDARGRIVGGRLFEVPEAREAGFARALGEAFAEPEVALVHVRALEYGCFQFEVRRP
ncbi:DUF1203 domain-containing protein [Streptomyces klenkii]|uniref:DUF1203 domain-containing protein n=1 Tax=Streptomyces klenkii TaxID=1420899 RepID=UPI003448D484